MLHLFDSLLVGIDLKSRRSRLADLDARLLKDIGLGPTDLIKSRRRRT
jgi:uncharacterized protein YjiS (DUF1127 family)